MRLLRFILCNKRPFKFLLANFLRVTGLSRFFVIDRWDYRMKFYPTNLLTATWTDVNYNIGDVEFVKKVLRPWEVFIDIWANVWTITLQGASIVGDRGLVLSFEPTPKIYRYLDQNIQFNNFSNTIAVNKALWNQKGTMRFNASHADTMNKIDAHWKGNIEIQVDVLDHYMDMIWSRNVSLMKVDVEGYEKFIFEWWQWVVKKTDVIYFEAEESMYHHVWYTTKDVTSLLISLWFGIYKMYGNYICRVPENYITRSDNLLAIRDEKDFISRTWFVIY